MAQPGPGVAVLFHALVEDEGFVLSADFPFPAEFGAYRQVPGRPNRRTPAI